MEIGQGMNMVVLPAEVYENLVNKVDHLTHLIEQNALPEKTDNRKTWLNKAKVKEITGITSDKGLAAIRNSGRVKCTRLGLEYVYEQDSLHRYMEERAEVDKFKRVE